MGAESITILGAKEPQAIILLLSCQEGGNGHFWLRKANSKFGKCNVTFKGLDILKTRGFLPLFSFVMKEDSYRSRFTSLSHRSQHFYFSTYYLLLPEIIFLSILVWMILQRRQVGCKSEQDYYTSLGVSSGNIYKQQ